MARPRMIVVASPPGSGKSTRFPLSSLATDFFNADDHAAKLNAGSYHKISKQIRARVNAEFQQWIVDHINAGTSFAIETTLRSPITFDQARFARENGFWTVMYFVSAGSVSESVKRVTERSYRGGHSASERLIGEIYSKSMQNLLTALDFRRSSFDFVRVYDNARFERPILELMGVRQGKVSYVANEVSP